MSPALYKTNKCFEVDVNERLIFCAMSPTVASCFFFKKTRIESRLLFANAFKVFSVEIV